MIRKEISSTGELYVYMNGDLLYKKWKDGSSILFEEYGLNTRGSDRDRGSYGGVALDDKSGWTGWTDSTETLADMVVGLLDDDVDLHLRNGAKALVLSVVDALYWLQDKGRLSADIPAIREHFDIDRLLNLANEFIHPDMPAAIRKQLHDYVLSLHVPAPGDAPGKMPDARHCERQALLAGVFAKLEVVYGHIFPMTKKVDA
ncbi:hypothetical protein [Rhizobium leguminosarum]|uniref:hypothetical protein n=1 Tax=Rhizobium leguminosarum TaxID=384 RepID=UPI002E161CA1|nr:hypothetical protein U8Q02_40650 [Rhizobium leguminosarum]